VTALVVGLGTPDRGDDGVGPVVAAEVGRCDLPGLHVVRLTAPAELLHLVDGYDSVVVVDALRSGGVPGRVRVLNARVPGNRAAGTHDLGLAEVVALARELGRLPPRFTIVAIEGECFDTGTALSPRVERAVPVAVDAVMTALE
jgi:hydrogenase maturation protease